MDFLEKTQLIYEFNIKNYVYWLIRWLVDKYNNTYHRKTKMKPIDVKTSTYIDVDYKNNNKEPKFKVVDDVRILKYEKIFAKS